MKKGGKSWNGSPNAKRGVIGSFKCSVCGRQYKMSWAKDNHEKLCKE